MLNQNAKAFGSFGVVIGLFAYILIGVTISMVCAVFGPSGPNGDRARTTGRGSTPQGRRDGHEKPP